MHVKVKLIQPSTKPHRLADAIVELADADGHSIVVSDIRILQNRQGQAWVAMPSRSLTTGGRSFSYLPQVEASKQLLKRIEEAVLTAYEHWLDAHSTPEVSA